MKVKVISFCVSRGVFFKNLGDFNNGREEIINENCVRDYVDNYIKECYKGCEDEIGYEEFIERWMMDEEVRWIDNVGCWMYGDESGFMFIKENSELYEDCEIGDLEEVLDKVCEKYYN